VGPHERKDPNRERRALHLPERRLTPLMSVKSAPKLRSTNPTKKRLGKLRFGDIFCFGPGPRPLQKRNGRSSSYQRTIKGAAFTERTNSASGGLPGLKTTKKKAWLKKVSARTSAQHNVELGSLRRSGGGHRPEKGLLPKNDAMPLTRRGRARGGKTGGVGGKETGTEGMRIRGTSGRRKEGSSVPKAGLIRLEKEVAREGKIPRLGCAREERT